MDTATHVKPRACIIDRDGTLARIDRSLVDTVCPNCKGFPCPYCDGPEADYHTLCMECDRCENTGKVHADWAAFNAAIPFDTPVPAIVKLTQCLDPDIHVLVTTGRSEDFRWTMMGWLQKHGVRVSRMIMRGSKDMRSDDKVKLDLYRDCIEPFYDVQFVVDDRPSVVSAWESIGLPVIAVAQPEHLLEPFSYISSREVADQPGEGVHVVSQSA